MSAQLLRLIAALSLAACSVASATDTVGAATDWPSHGGGADESGFSQLIGIAADLRGPILETRAEAVGGDIASTHTLQ